MSRHGVVRNNKRMTTNHYQPFYSIGGGELFDRVIEDEFVLTERACRVFVKQILEGVNYIHRQGIIHLDLKVNYIFYMSGRSDVNSISKPPFSVSYCSLPLIRSHFIFGSKPAKCVGLTSLRNDSHISGV